MSLKYRDVTGKETPIAGLNGLSGELVPSTSYYQTGYVDVNDYVAAGAVSQCAVTLASPMPDNDYVVIVNPSKSQLNFIRILNKTTTGFSVQINARADAAGYQLNWQAFKLMTDESRAIDEQVIAQNADAIAAIQEKIPSTASTTNKLATASDIPDISGKQDKTLATALTIGGSSRTTVEGALGALNGVVPSTASASNQLITRTTANDYLTNLGWGSFSGSTIGESVVAGVNSLLTNIDVTRLYMLRGTYPAIGYWQAFISPPRTPSGNMWQAFVQYERVGTDSHTSRGLYIVEFSYDSSADAGSKFTLVNESSVVKSSDLTSTVTSGSTAPITSGGVADYINTGVAHVENTNTFTFDLPALTSGDVWEITVSAQTWNGTSGIVTKYIASRSGTSYRLSNCGGVTTGHSATISENTVAFVWTNTDNTIAYWRARYVKLI